MTEKPSHPAGSNLEDTAGTENTAEPGEGVENDELQFDTLPNRLTLLRMGFVPLVVAALYLSPRGLEWDFVAAVLFGLASLTDYFDGYFARTQKLVTIYGKLMDPLADKFLVISSMVMLQHLGRIEPVVVILVLCREMAILGLRALASAEGVIIAASDSAKWKTATQMVAIPMIMLKDGLWGLPIYVVGQGLMFFSLFMSLWSAKDYAVNFFKELRRRRARKRAQKRALQNQAP